MKNNQPRESNYHEFQIDEYYGVVDTITRKIIIDAKYDYIYICPSNLRYIVVGYNNLQKRISPNTLEIGKVQQLFDISTNSLLPIQSESILISKEFIFIKKDLYAIFTLDLIQLTDYKYQVIEFWYDNMIVVKVNDTFGVLDNELNEIIPYMYESIYPIEEKNIFIAEYENRWLVLDYDNKIIFSSTHNYKGCEWWGLDQYYIKSLNGYIEHFDNKILFHSLHNPTKEYFVKCDTIEVSEDDYIIKIEDNDCKGYINLKTGYIHKLALNKNIKIELYSGVEETL